QNDYRKEGSKKKGCSAINKVVAREYTINIHKNIHGVGFKKSVPGAPGVPQVLRHPEICHKGDVHMDTRFNKAVWPTGIRNVLYHICVHLTSKHNEDKNSPNTLYTLVTYAPVTLSKIYRQFMWVSTKCFQI
ncbi:RL31 protein, partial [Crocuta crocuta]